LKGNVKGERGGGAEQIGFSMRHFSKNKQMSLKPRSGYFEDRGCGVGCVEEKEEEH